MYNERIYTFKDGRETIFDSDDTALICQYSIAIDNNGYVRARYCTGGKDSFILLHRLVMNAPKGVSVDHINRDKLDNRKTNLRFANQSQNAANSIKPTGFKNKYKGVQPYYRRWRANIGVNYKRIHLGVFATEQEAAKAYNAAAVKYFGEFAYLNDITNN